MNPLPHILAIFTGQREKMVSGVDFKWSSNVWTHNVFRVYELLFWRKRGVRLEVTADSDGNYTFYTFEARLAHYEGMIRQLPRLMGAIFSKHKQKLWFPSIPAYQWQRGAVGYDTSGIQSTASASPSISLTLSGSDRCLMAAPDNGTSDAISGVTWNTTGTLLQVYPKAFKAAGVNWQYLYYLKAPTATTANVVASSSNADARLIAAHYTGVDQTYIPDNFTQTNGGTSSSTITLTLTTNQDKCWTFIATADDNGGETGGAGTTVRATDAFGMAIADSNGAVTPAGSNTLTVNIPSARTLRAGIMLSFPPYPGSNIAYDTSIAPGNGVSSSAMTFSGSNRFALVSVWSLTDTSTAVDIGGQKGRLIAKSSYPGAGRQGIALWYVENPPSGSQTVACTVSGAAFGFLCASYNGAGRAVDAIATDTATASSFQIDLTTLTDNSWLVASVANNSGDAATSSDGNARQHAGTGRSYVDKATTTAGANSVTTSGAGFGAGTGWGAIVAAISPVYAPAAVTRVGSMLAMFR